VTQGRGRPRQTQPNVRSDVMRPAAIWRTGPGPHQLPFSLLSDVERAFLHAQSLNSPGGVCQELPTHDTGREAVPLPVAGRLDYRVEGRFPPGAYETRMDRFSTMPLNQAYSSIAPNSFYSRGSGSGHPIPAPMDVSAPGHRLSGSHPQPDISTSSSLRYGGPFRPVQPSHHDSHVPEISEQYARNASQPANPTQTAYGYTAWYPPSFVQTPPQSLPNTFQEITPRGLRRLPPRSPTGDFAYFAHPTHRTRVSTAAPLGHLPGGSFRSSQVQPPSSGYASGGLAPVSSTPQPWHDPSYPSVISGLPGLRDISGRHLPGGGTYTSHPTVYPSPGFQDEGDRYPGQPSNSSYWPSHPSTQGDGR
jgi:hypothetical protein